MTADKLQVVAIIPVRGSDPEVEHGRMVTIGDKALLAHTIEAAHASSHISRVLVSTDDDEVARLAREHGAEAPFLRPKELSAPGVPLTRVLQYTLAWLEERDGYRADLVVLLEITHPLRPEGLIDRTIEALSAEHLDSVFAAREERHEFWTFDAQGKLQRVQPREEMPRQVLQPLYKEMGGMVTVARAELVRAGRRLGDRVGLVPVRDLSSLIDLHDDDGLKLAKALLEQERQEFT